MPLEQKYVSRPRVCQELGVSKSTVRRWTNIRQFPKPLKGSGRVPIYDFNAVRAWLENGGDRDE